MADQVFKETHTRKDNSTETKLFSLTKTTAHKQAAHRQVIRWPSDSRKWEHKTKVPHTPVKYSPVPKSVWRDGKNYKKHKLRSDAWSEIVP